MKRNLLIHSMAEFFPIVNPVLDIVDAKVICEIGAEHGGNSKKLYDYLKPKEGKLISIDLAPSQDFIAWKAAGADKIIQHISKASLEAIPEVSEVDAWFVDGDHNWYTVYNELVAIRQNCQKNGKPFLVFMHDVSWPWARRDLYYAPERIPAEYLKPHTWELGVHIDTDEAIEGGFRSNGNYAMAIKAGGPCNGVLTAVEDFIHDNNNEYYWAFIPAVFGLGVMFDCSHPLAGQIGVALDPFHQHPLLASLEINRLANYLRVIELQDLLEKERNKCSEA